MTRPNIVRADTIDLQDQNNPTAAEHQKPAFHGGLAPHQRAEVHHVIQERSSEENALHDAWNASGNLTEEPEAIDQAEHHHSTEPTMNGRHHEEGDGGAETETDGEDEMMDRISSSPSIDDGGYSFHSSPPTITADSAEWTVTWPERISSLSPSLRDTPTPTRETFNQSSPESSPFLQTPQHLPLRVCMDGGEDSSSPTTGRSQALWRPFLGRSGRLPLVRVEQADDSISYASKHHQMGKYRTALDGSQKCVTGKDEKYAHESDTEAQANTSVSDQGHGTSEDVHFGTPDQWSEDSETVHDIDTKERPIESPFRTHPFSHSFPDTGSPELKQSPSLTSIQSVDLQDVLLPVDDPLLDTPPSPTDSSGSWESLASERDSMDQDAADDDTDAFFIGLDDRFIDSGWGGECLRETEDIDFEFVYALHTFVATVEGQANATKGDTMVLLDDSNSYWWLVRVVKDSSIGYLPAEHIETPTERLARLNKHRNIDLSATMLSDNSEKSRNPLKKAIRRRNAKTVQFAAPTYVEASDYEYDTEDEEQPPSQPLASSVQREEPQQNGDHNEAAQSDEKRLSQDEAPRAGTPTRLSFDREQAATVAAAAAAEDPQASPKLVDKTEAAPLKSRKTRNTDSFLKDDSIETRKITLTPGLLREDGSVKSTSDESTRNNSLENLVKQVSPPEQPSKKDSKKEKEKKKGGMLSGLFKSKKKDKKSKDDLAEQYDEKRSGEFSRESPRSSPLPSGRSSPSHETSALSSPQDTRRPEVQTRQPSRGKLQKTPPVETASPVREPQQAQVQQTQQTEQKPEQAPRTFVAELDGSEAAKEPETATPSGPAPIDTTTAQEEKPKEGPLSPLTNILKRDDSKTQKPTKAKRAKQRVELDDFDSPVDDDDESEPNPFKEQEQRAVGTDGDKDSDRLSDSPVEITSNNTFMHGTDIIHIPTPSPYYAEDDEDEEPESLTSSPSIIEHPAEPAEALDAKAPTEDSDSTPTGPRSPQPVATGATTKTPSPPNRGLSTDSTATSSSATHLSPATTVSQQWWSDSSLRAWLEDGSEVKDMMTMIYDKSGVVPVSDDHPMMVGLFTEQKKGVQDMMGQLDGLLGSYLQRKGISLG